MAAGPYDNDRLSSLVDHKNEEPDVEYKTWMNLSEPENKAKIAKHLCALANYGGGWLIFGVSDDGTHSEPHPEDLAGYKQDLINSIVSRYLHPIFHCNVHFVRSSLTGKIYPVVRVPPHGSQPVSAKTDGPQVENCRVGVTRGAHYIRVPGPQSVPIDKPELWQQVLRRCVTQEREQLVGSISRLLESPTVSSTSSSLDEFTKQTAARWADMQKSGWPVDPLRNFTQLGFELFSETGAQVAAITLKALSDAAREASNQVELDCHEVSPPFDLSYVGLTSPSVILFGNDEGYEGGAVVDRESYVFAPTLSRITINGLGSEVRTYHEDSNWVIDLVRTQSSNAWPAGTRLSPKFQASRIYGFILFVRNLASAFSDATRVKVSIDYGGLAGRSLDEPRGGYMLRGVHKSAAVPNRHYEIEVPVEKLAGRGAAETAVLLANSVFRLFSGWEVNAERVLQYAKES